VCLAIGISKAHIAFAAMGDMSIKAVAEQLLKNIRGGDR